MIEEIFVEAADLPRDARGEFLRRRCSGDSSLRREVEALLAHDERAGETFLDGATAARQATGPDEFPALLAKYRIVRQLGAGGMGVVYEAQEASLRRSVALKVVRPGMISREVLRRFAYEVQVLAQLRHPGIAQMYEAGEFDDDGHRRPYFAMELIVGEPLDRSCRRRSVDVRGRLELMARVCDAVEHAHERGVIHRDLKPGNIFVDESGAPKILDFGVSRLASRPGDLTTFVTSAGQIIGTLPYMSPEQVSGEPGRIDARSDVYALGVVLYELLSGRIPLDVSDRPIPEAARMIREDEPPLLGRVSPVFRGDIETVVAKAMNKEQERRYGSAKELAEDLRRYLRDEPIVARPTGTFEHVRRFARRNTGLAWGVAAALAILVVGVVAVGYLALGQARQRERAEQLTAKASRSEAESLYAAYKSAISAAQAAAQSGDIGGLRRELSATPEPLRSWEWKFLAHLGERAVARADARLGKSLAMSVSRQGVVFFGLEEGGVGAWDGVSATRVVYRMQEQVQFISLSPDGARLLLQLPSRVICIDTQGVEQWTVKGSFGFQGSAFHPDGTRVMMADRVSGRAVEFSVIDGSRQSEFGPPRPGLGFAGYSPTGRYVLVCIDYTLEMYDAQSQQLIRTCDAITFAFSPDDRLLLKSDTPRAGVLIDIESGKTVGEVISKDAEGVDAWSISEWFIVAAERNGSLAVFDRRTLEPADRVLVGRRNAAAAFFPDGMRIVATTGGDPQPAVFDLASGPAPFVMKDGLDRVACSALSPDGTFVASGGWGSISLWDPHKGLRTRTHAFTDEWIDAIAVSPDSTRVVAVTRTKKIVLADREGAREIDVGRPFAGEREAAASPLPGLERRWRKIAWIDASRVALPGEGSELVIVSFDAAGTSGGQIERRVDLPSQATCVACDQRGTTFVGTADGTIVTLDSSGTPGRSWNAHAAPIVHLAVSPDGARLATVDGDNTLCVFASATGARICSQPLRSMGSSVAWSPDQARLAIACDSCAVAIADPATGETLMELKADGVQGAFGVAFADDGSSVYALGAPFAWTVYESRQPPSRESRLERSLNLRATVIVRRTRQDSLLVGAELEAALEADTSLPQALRRAAVAVARGEGDVYRWTNSIAWGVAVRSDGSQEAYARAVKLSEKVHAAFPDNSGYLNTLGVVYFRAKRYGEAIDALTRSDVMYRKEHGASHPLDIMTLAMAYRRAGKAEEARTTAARVEELMKLPEFANDPECIRFAAELKLTMSE